eukprot:CAMPEP_0113621334 /NCGR_PEP_ID=MMETSP0017_2-20120614/10899_1 /TAXON_ID=2856 /ORGANISM="Cylindrotheca closterium" /LENGTH=77 /DNA_ID=CAMNT_0000531071 /DNA_START=41 /DNA_END=274 /DNA_ORIENTATION=- /assembly_acc=CAM_ASM_000147
MTVFRSKDSINSLKAKIIAKSLKKTSTAEAVKMIVKHAPKKRRKQLRRGSKTAFMLFHDCSIVSQELQGEIEVIGNE